MVVRYNWLKRRVGSKLKVKYYSEIELRDFSFSKNVYLAFTANMYGNLGFGYPDFSWGWVKEGWRWVKEGCRWVKEGCRWVNCLNILLWSIVCVHIIKINLIKLYSPFSSLLFMLTFKAWMVERTLIFQPLFLCILMS